MRRNTLARTAMLAVLVTLLCAGTSACARRSSSSQTPITAPVPPPTSPPPTDPVDRGPSQAPVTAAAWQTLAATIGSQLASPGCGGSAETCPTTTVQYLPPAVTPGTHDPVILILDGGDSVAAGLRYQNRVLGRFRLDGHGALTEIHPSYVVAKGAAAIYQELAPVGKIVPQSLTAPFAKDFQHAFVGSAWSPYLTSHLNWVFNILAANVPDAYFVLVDTSTVNEAGHADLCDLGEDAQARIKSRYGSYAAALHDLITRYGVGYINLSAGYSRSQLMTNGWFGCPAVPNDRAIDGFLNITSDFVADLAADSRVTLVQAGVAASYPLAVDDPAAPGDCRRLPGRIRIGYFLKKDSGLGPFGTPAVGSGVHGEGELADLLPDDQLSAAACIDLYVNFGFELNADYEGDPGPTPLQTGLLGMEYRFKEDLLPASSWAAPLALAHLIHLQESAWAKGGSRLSAQDLLRAARGGDREVKAIDPLRNRQFTVINPI